MAKRTQRTNKRPTTPAPVRAASPTRQQPERKTWRAREVQRQRRRLFLRVAVGALVALAVLAGGLFVWPQLAKPSASYPAQFKEDQGRDHITAGQAHPAYNSTPPTSGWHYAGTSTWGIHDQPIEDELQVHNLEHGGIMVQYWCPEGCPALVAQLRDVAGRYRSKVILAPYARPLPNRIALTAWRWIDTFDDFDEQRVVSFIDGHKNRAPEQVPD